MNEVYEKFKIGLKNYYGEVQFVRHGNNYTMTLQDWAETSTIPISEAFYNLAKAEFSPQPKQSPDQTNPKTRKKGD